MHGRVKVRTSEEKAEAERREKAEKVRVYREITSKIFAKRAAGELDGEGLQLTRQLLELNPDISTLWNYRREIIQSSLTTLPAAEATSVADKELSLTQRCLRVNPKSYCVWLHRQWVLEHSPQPDWTHEKALCDLFLQYDERNFHCWDYRRFVTTKAELPPEEEFAFTYDKIASNFSNYSAWHYRSKLLPLLHPSPDGRGGVDEGALLKEHELAQNAFFTDPNDQSAWLYHRWLLGRAEPMPSLVGALLLWQPQPEIVAVFNYPLKPEHPIKVDVGGASFSSSVQSDWPIPLWRCPIPHDIIPSNKDSAVVSISYSDVTMDLAPGQKDGWRLGGGGGGGGKWMFGSALTAAASTVLETGLESCRELLQLEPNNKWCLLTTLLLMQAIDAQSYHQNIGEMYDQLILVDPYRKGHYQDMWSQLVIEHALFRVFKEEISSSSSTTAIIQSPHTLKLSGLKLSRLYHTQYLSSLTTLDLSHNTLYSIHDVEYLLSLHTLLLDQNCMEEVPSCVGKLISLRVLSIRNNKLGSAKSLSAAADLSLEVLRVGGNPLTMETDWRALLANVLPHVKEIDDVMVTSS